MKAVLVPGKKYTPWKVHFPGGKRRFFKTEDEAKQAIFDHTKGRVNIGKRKLDEVLYCESLLGETPLLTAVRFYLEHHQAVSGKATLGEACELYWASVNTETASEFYTGPVRKHLDWVKKGLKSDTPLTEISALTYQTFIRGLDSLSQQHAHHRTCRGLFNYAVAHHLMAKNPTHTAAKRRDDWTPPKLPNKRPVILTVEAAHLLLDWSWLHCPRIIPAFVLQLFCGIRTAELCRKPTKHKRPLDWEDLKWDRRIIDIPAEVSKTGERRVIDWVPEIVWDWLAPYRQDKGKVCCEDYQHLKYRQIKACTDSLAEDEIVLGFDQNAFRHSFASYAVSFFQSAERVALLMGHRGSNMLFQHYRDYTTQADAKAFFSIRPSYQQTFQLLLTHDFESHDESSPLLDQAAA